MDLKMFFQNRILWFWGGVQPFKIILRISSQTNHEVGQKWGISKKNNKQCLLDTPRTETVNEKNYYEVYKGHTKWLSLKSSHFARKNNYKGQ